MWEEMSSSSKLTPGKTPSMGTERSSLAPPTLQLLETQAGLYMSVGLLVFCHRFNTMFSLHVVR